MRFLRQTFGADIIARIRSSISEDLETTRSGLSRQLCEWLDWRSVNGKLREIDARKALLALEREGLIQLPPARIRPQHLREQDKQPPPPQVPVEAALHSLGEITLVAVSKKESELSRLWNSLMDAHHPLGSGPLCGAQQRYGYTPVLLESFVDESAYDGTCYRAANWGRIGETSGRGRQDRHNACAAGRKAIYLLALTKQWRRGLHSCSSRPLTLPQQEQDDWAEVEFGRVDFVDRRLRERLLIMARDFFAQPLAPIPQACGGNSAKTKAAYRFLSNKNVDIDTLLAPHIEATAKRMEAHPVVLVAQDTTSLNYNTHKATEGRCVFQ